MCLDVAHAVYEQERDEAHTRERFAALRVDGSWDRYQVPRAAAPL